MILDIGRSVGDEENSTRFIMAVLAAEMKWSESRPIDGVHVAAIIATGLLMTDEDRGCLRVSPPGRLVQGAIPVLCNNNTMKKMILGIRRSRTEKRVVRDFP